MARKGQSATALTARPKPVLQTLVLQTPVLAVLVGVPGLGAVVDREFGLAWALLIPAAILTGLGIWSRRHDPEPDLRRVEAVVTLALVFVLSGVLTLPAFMALGLRPLDAFFEGISGITTTGLSVARDAESWPVSGHFLRAWMQWCGGVVVAVAGVALLMGAGRAAQMLGRESVGSSGYLASTRAKARVILVGYTGLTVIAVIGALVLIPGWWEGPMIALAAVSTGGFTPRDTSLAEYDLAAQVFIMSICVTGAVSLLFYAVAMRQGVGQAIRRGTVPVTLSVIVAGTALMTAIHGLSQGWDADRLVEGALNHVSAQTTAGFSVGPVLPVGPAVVIMMAAMVMGGDVGSTTGGLKTGRTRALAAMIGLILLRLRLPERAVSHAKVGHSRIETDRLVFAAALLTVYLISMFAFWLMLLAGGHEAMHAIFDAISALSGVGLSTGVIGPELAPALKAAAIVAMLLGRLEFFALILLFLPATWSTGR